MAEKAPGKHYRKGISLPELFKMFPDDDAAQAWLEQERWNGEPWCPHCGSFKVKYNKHPSMPWRCAERECRKRFSVRVGTPLYRSPLGYQTWVVAIYLMTTSLKSISSMKLHRDLNITQKTAWHLAHRIRESFYESGIPDLFSGPVEVDETFVGGKRSKFIALMFCTVANSYSNVKVVKKYIFALILKKFTLFPLITKFA